MSHAPDLVGLRVCFVAGTLGQGGAERQLFYIIQALANAGAAVRLLSLTRGEHWEAPIRQLGAEVVWVGEQPSRLARLARICTEARRWRPHIVQSQHFFTNLYATAAARVSGAFEIGAIRSDVLSEVRSNGRILGGLSLRLPRCLAVNSAAAFRTAAAAGVPVERLRLLANVVDTDRFRPGPPPPSDPIRVLTIGRMTEEKRYDRFLEVVATVRAQSDQDVVAVLAGAGPLREQLERRADDLGLLPDGVEFLGPREDTAPLYRAAHIFLLTSDYEGCPNVVLEAMASGLPVIATRVGGVPELIEHGDNGLLADKQDVDGLIAALYNLVENPDERERLSVRAREFVERRYCPALLVSTLQELYSSALPQELLPVRA